MEQTPCRRVRYAVGSWQLQPLCPLHVLAASGRHLNELSYCTVPTVGWAAAGCVRGTASSSPSQPSFTVEAYACTAAQVPVFPSTVHCLSVAH